MGNWLVAATGLWQQLAVQQLEQLVVQRMAWFWPAVGHTALDLGKNPSALVWRKARGRCMKLWVLLTYVP